MLNLSIEKIDIMRFSIIIIDILMENLFKGERKYIKQFLFFKRSLFKNYF